MNKLHHISASIVLLASPAFFGAWGCVGAPGASAPAGEDGPVAAVQQAAGDGPICVTIQRGLSGAVADALIDSGTGNDGSPNANYGGSCSLTASMSPSGRRRALLRFDLGAIPAGATVTSATATLHTLLYGGAPLRVHRITAPWSESTVTWASFDEAFSPAIEALLPAGSPAAADLTPLVQAWVNGLVENDGILLERDLGSTVFASSDCPSTSMQGKRPRLDVCYVPSPSAGGSCPQNPTNFDVRDSKDITYNGNDYLLLKVSITSTQSIASDWCHEYRDLCQCYGYHPTGCGDQYNTPGSGYDECFSTYESHASNGGIGCNPSMFVAAAAQQAGYGDANAGNSFGFHSCYSAPGSCSRTLCSSGYCNNGLSYFDASLPHGYTVCRKPPY